MPYIYKYTDKKDGAVKYVGIIKKDSNFPRRFVQHKSDAWANDGDWEIEYCYFDSVTDVEMLEGHFISHYGTHDWYNTAKRDWGRSSFDVRVDWKLYKSYTSGGAWMQERYFNLLHEMVGLQSRMDELHSEVESIGRLVFDEIKHQQVKWIQERLFDVYPYTYELPIKEAFDDFMDYVGNAEYVCMDEWIAHLYDRQCLKGRIIEKDDELFIIGYYLTTKENFESIRERVFDKRNERLKDLLD